MPEDESMGKVAKLLKVWVPIIAGIVGIIVGLCQLKICCPIGPPTPPFHFSGIVRYQNGGEPVQGAVVRVMREQGAHPPLGQATTNPQGHFSITLQDLDADRVWVVVIRNNQLGFAGYLPKEGQHTIQFGGSP